METKKFIGFVCAIFITGCIAGYHYRKKKEKKVWTEVGNEFIDSFNAEVEIRRKNRKTTEILFETRADAEKVLDLLHDSILNYGVVTMADFYDLCGLTHSTYPVVREKPKSRHEYNSYHNYGWADLTSAFVTRTRLGYLIHMPNAELLTKNEKEKKDGK